MKIKEKLCNFYKKINNKCLEQFGFNVEDVTFDKIVLYMYTPKDASSLAVTRILFGLAMLFDIPDERGGATMVKRWGDPQTCHFPLLPILQPMPLPFMALVYAALWLGAFGIMLGYKFSITAPIFTACYWYLFLIEKSFWNNHSYLFGLVALLLTCTQANCYWSLDSYLDPSKKKQTVPYWNYFILKYQFFILYFMAGMKKGTTEWLTGYSVQNLSEHWVFDPFKYFLTVSQTDYLVVHWFVFMFDLTVAVWMMWAYTRHAAMVFCALFHLMNSRLFSIGMFPWVCLATMPLFYPFDWPKKVLSYSRTIYKKTSDYLFIVITQMKAKSTRKCENKVIDTADTSNTKEIAELTGDNLCNNDNSFNETNTNDVQNKDDNRGMENKKMIKDSSKCDKDVKEISSADQDDTENAINSNCNKKIKTIYLIAIYVFMQAFLPYSHFITKGYNNWTEGLYGYSWDMMVHTWDSSNVIVKVIDNDRKKVMYVDPKLYTLNDRWSRHGDMVYQYVQCLKRNIEIMNENKCDDKSNYLLNNISIYIDVWCGMNGRFVQRMFDPRVDLLQAKWSPFNKVSYLMPLLNDAIYMRKDLDEIRNEVHSWSNYSDVVFMADFPGYEQEKYIPWDLKNISLTVLKGTVVYEPEPQSKQIGQSYKLSTYDHINVSSGIFHKVLNIDETPSFYMYTFYNMTKPNLDKFGLNVNKTKLPILRELYKRFHGMFIFANLVINNIFQIFKCINCN